MQTYLHSYVALIFTESVHGHLAREKKPARLSYQVIFDNLSKAIKILGIQVIYIESKTLSPPEGGKDNMFGHIAFQCYMVEFELVELNSVFKY